MSEHYKLDFPKMSPSDIKRIFYSKERSNMIERGKRKFWWIKHRHRTSNEKKISRYIHTRYHKIHKPWRMITKRFRSKPGLFLNSIFYFLYWLFYLDPQIIFNFLDVNQKSSLTYLEFRSWMLLIDRTLPEFDILQIFNDIDQNRRFFFWIISFLWLIF